MRQTLGEIMMTICFFALVVVIFALVINFIVDGYVEFNRGAELGRLVAESENHLEAYKILHNGTDGDYHKGIQHGYLTRYNELTLEETHSD